MLKPIIVAAGTIAVTVAEKASHVTHAHEPVKIVVGAAFALPFLLILWFLLWRESRAKADAPASGTRTAGYGYSLRQPGRRG